MNNHYYLLPDGRRADTLKDVSRLFEIPYSAARSLVKNDILKKVIENAEEHITNEINNGYKESRINQ